MITHKAYHGFFTGKISTDITEDHLWIRPVPHLGNLFREYPALNSSMAPHTHTVSCPCPVPPGLSVTVADLPGNPQRRANARFSELEDSIPTSSRDTFDSFCSCVSNPSLNPALTSILSMDFPVIAYCWWTGNIGLYGCLQAEKENGARRFRYRCIPPSQSTV